MPFDHNYYGNRLGRIRFLSYKAKFLFYFCFGASHAFARKFASILDTIDKIRATLSQLAQTEGKSTEIYPLEASMGDDLAQYFAREVPSEKPPEWAKTPSKQLNPERWKRFDAWLQETKNILNDLSTAVEASYGKNSEAKKVVVAASTNLDEVLKIFTARTQNGVFQ